MPQPVNNPPNPWHSQHVEWLDEPPADALHVYEEDARSTCRWDMIEALFQTHARRLDFTIGERDATEVRNPDRQAQPLVTLRKKSPASDQLGFDFTRSPTDS